MTIDNDRNPEDPIFSAMITPHRSLNQVGFVVLMVALSIVSFAAGMLFLLMGAWPVFGFFGLDVLLLYWAFRVNYRRAAAYEQVIVTPTELTVRRVSHRGRVSEWTLNPLWVRLERDVMEEFGLQQLFLVSRGRKLPVGGFLGPDEKESLAKALGVALSEARRGPTRTALV